MPRWSSPLRSTNSSPGDWSGRGGYGSGSGEQRIVGVQLAVDAAAQQQRGGASFADVQIELAGVPLNGQGVVEAGAVGNRLQCGRQPEGVALDGDL